MKQQVDERLIEIAMNRLAREIRTKKDIVSHWFLVGYHEAVCDILWDYTKTGMKSLDWEQYMTEQESKGFVKRGIIALKDIKKIERGGEKKNEM